MLIPCNTYDEQDDGFRMDVLIFRRDYIARKLCLLGTSRSFTLAVNLVILLLHGLIHLERSEDSSGVGQDEKVVFAAPTK